MKVNMELSEDHDKVEVEISTRDTWSLDYSLALVILPALKKFREVSFDKVTWGCFCWTEDGQDVDREIAKQKMNEVMDKMIFAFQTIIEDCAIFEKHEEIQEGLDLFAKYYMQLWW